ncbi:MAG: carbon-nitrogen family hydrolase [Actinomycetes bacterium]
MRIDVIQLAYDLGEPVAQRVQRAAGLVRGRAGADLVVLPELWPQGGFAYTEWAAGAENLTGPIVTAMQAAARDVGAVVHMGSFVERVDPQPAGQPPAGHAPLRPGLYNTSVLIGGDGALLATYRKIHLFGFGEGEPALLSAGDTLVVADPPGLPRTGLATCYDLRFPELFRGLVDAGAELVVLPAAWPAARVEHWRLLVRARAIEDQVLLVAVNTAGSHAGVEMGGSSVVLGPWGEVFAEAGPGEEVLVVQVDPTCVAATRRRFPVLADRRLAR